MHDEAVSHPHILPRFSSSIKSDALLRVLWDMLNNKVKRT